jgi:uncharacterized damage-inducible protein DinB
VRYHLRVSEFDTDLADNTAAVNHARADLLNRLRTLTDADLDRGRRGGWTIRDVLRHVIIGEVAYARVIAHLRSLALKITDITDEDVRSASAVRDALARVRAALTAALDGVDEAAFYDLRAVGHEQYSVLSVLENVANHDREHLEQIEKILAP